MLEERKNKKVVVAMSGGVDSSVAAALLKRTGVDELRSSSRFANACVFDVIGVFMKLVDSPRFCQAEKRARRVAKILKIPFLVLDLRKEFKKKIIDSFLEEYKRGDTPNPCVDCNNQIKFKLLFKKAKRTKGDFLATGHYARLKKKDSKISLLGGADKEKDQSYFLWQLSQKDLKRVIFPIGNYAKKEVKILAKEFNLPVLDSKESQEICFIPKNINDFLKKYLKLKPGPIVEKSHYGTREIVGQHQGLAFYTIGQRKGIGLAGGPYYVLDKNFKKNILIVTKNEKDLFKKELITRDINWISGKTPELPLKAVVKIRYRHKPAPATIYPYMLNTKYKIRFSKPQRAITPGQSVVFYKGQEVVGGGIIC